MNGTTKCQQCLDAFSNYCERCDEINSVFVCQKCKVGYYKDDADGLCKSCGS